ncbi:hypothetical protein Xhom_02898 [Xenorhabdus hominickii]|uniref:Uncharacterized protein n=1 Tax=Xenorhabdus hominickii TaxID=351679 RepID=A0A2G0Q6S5_XENHO|nr:hypothetical protein Xhom_02898 [Xenorhabdus hominickii]
MDEQAKVNGLKMNSAHYNKIFFIIKMDKKKFLLLKIIF